MKISRTISREGVLSDLAGRKQGQQQGLENVDIYIYIYIERERGRGVRGKETRGETREETVGEW